MSMHFPDAVSQLIQIAGQWMNERLSDGGPRYAEYHPDLIVVEPWNAVSSVAMMLPAVFWMFKLWPKIKANRFLLFAVGMVFLGGLGSTLFHAFRMSSFFLMLDIVPSALLTIALSIYFWWKILGKWWQVVLLFVPLFMLRIFLFANLPQHLSINLSYAFSGGMILLPLFIFLYRNHFQHLTDVGLLLFFFSFALLFRQLDVHEIPFFEQGTHFLWHLLSAFGSWYVLKYISFVEGFQFQQLNDK